MPIIAGCIIWLRLAIIAIIGSASPSSSISEPVGLRPSDVAISVNSGR
ncbi:unannotated protein [freshwater metagenome]|uniref:Unannotated protein n=1 Tax=freshwater metagenome TaxID=449393 RepID=A0A6J6YRQ6_9ZZZZ